MCHFTLSTSSISLISSTLSNFAVSQFTVQPHFPHLPYPSKWPPFFPSIVLLPTSSPLPFSKPRLTSEKLHNVVSLPHPVFCNSPAFLNFYATSKKNIINYSFFLCNIIQYSFTIIFLTSNKYSNYLQMYCLPNPQCI